MGIKKLASEKLMDWPNVQKWSSTFFGFRPSRIRQSAINVRIANFLISLKDARGRKVGRYNVQVAEVCTYEYFNL